MDNNENTIFEFLDLKVQLLMKIVNWYLVINDDISAKEKNKLFNFNLAKNLFAFVDLRKIDLNDEIMVINITPKVEIILDPFGVLLHQLADALRVMEEADQIAKIVILYLREDIQSQSSDTQTKMEADLSVLLTVTFAKEFEFDFQGMLEWLLIELRPLVSNQKFIQTLEKLFQNMSERMTCRLHKYVEVARPLAGAGNEGVMEKAKTIPWQKIKDIDMAYAELFRTVFLWSLILYVEKVKREDVIDNNENTIFDFLDLKVQFLMKIVNWYLVINDDISAKEKNKLFNLKLAKNLFAFVDLRKIDLNDEIMVINTTPKVEIIFHPFAVLLHQLSDALGVMEEADQIAKIVIPYLREDIQSQSIDTQTKMEADLNVLLTVTFAKEFDFQGMLEWLLIELRPLVSNQKFIQTLEKLFQNMSERTTCRLHKYVEVARIRPLAGAGNEGVMEKEKAKTIPWQKIQDINIAYAELFRTVFLWSLIVYVEKVKREENPDRIE